MARKKKHEEHENHERWLVSYADFITLLFAFFVVMYAVSSVNEGKYRVLSDALVSAFRSAPKSMEPIQVGSPAKSPHETDLEHRTNPNVLKRPDMLINKSVRDQQLKSEKPRTKWPEQAEPEQAENDASGAGGKQALDSLNSIAEQIERAMSGLIQQNLVKVRRDEFWLEVEINTNILFPSGDARLQPDAKPILDELAKILRNFDNNIKVEGFTDNVPISNMIYPSNWELSAARAASVVNLLMNQGVRPTRMAAIGYGEFHPVTGNDTAEGRNKNRRVVLAVLENGASERVYDDKKFKEDASAPIPQLPEIEAPVPTTGALPLEAPPASAHVPVDVMGRDVTDRGIFTVIELPIKLPSAFPSNVLPSANTGLSGPGQGGG
jgi:chemotaxis protein MotB